MRALLKIKKNRTTRIFTIFNLWAHEAFVRWVPGGSVRKMASFWRVYPQKLISMLCFNTGWQQWYLILSTAFTIMLLAYFLDPLNVTIHLYEEAGAICFHQNVAINPTLTHMGLVIRIYATVNKAKLIIIGSGNGHRPLPEPMLCWNRFSLYAVDACLIFQVENI